MAGRGSGGVAGGLVIGKDLYPGAARQRQHRKLEPGAFDAKMSVGPVAPVLRARQRRAVNRTEPVLHGGAEHALIEGDDGLQFLTVQET